MIPLSLVAGSLSAAACRIVAQTACIRIGRLARVLILLGLLERLGYHLPCQGRLHLPTAMPGRCVHLLEKFPARICPLFILFFATCICALDWCCRSRVLLVFLCGVFLVPVVCLQALLVNCLETGLFRVSVGFGEEVVHGVETFPLFFAHCLQLFDFFDALPKVLQEFAELPVGWIPQRVYLEFKVSYLLVFYLHLQEMAFNLRFLLLNCTVSFIDLFLHFFELQFIFGF